MNENQAEAGVVLAQSPVRRFARAVARWAGLYIVTPDALLELTVRATEHAKIAGHYDRSDPELRRVNDARAEAYNRALARIMRDNEPNDQGDSR